MQIWSIGKLLRAVVFPHVRIMCISKAHFGIFISSDYGLTMRQHLLILLILRISMRLHLLILLICAFLWDHTFSYFDSFSGSITPTLLSDLLSNKVRYLNITKWTLNNKPIISNRQIWKVLTVEIPNFDNSINLRNN